MPDFKVRELSEEDRRALYRFIASLGAAGQPAPAYACPLRVESSPRLKPAMTAASP
jgi:hypothetical protein